MQDRDRQPYAQRGAQPHDDERALGASRRREAGVPRREGLLRYALGGSHDDRDRGLQGNYGEANRHFGFDEGVRHDPRPVPRHDAHRDHDRYGEPSLHDRDRGLQGNYGAANRYFGFDGPTRDAAHASHGGWAAQVARGVKRAFRGPKGYTRSDERIREDVCDRLGEQHDVDPSDIEVTVAGGEVTLAGTVRSRQEKFHVEAIADAVSGVTEVHNRLRLRP